MRLSATNSQPAGQVLLLAVLMVAILLMFVSFLPGLLITVLKGERSHDDQALALQLAESGIDRAVYCLNNAAQCSSPYTSDSQTTGAGAFSLTVTTQGSNRIITSTGTVNGRSRVVEVTLANQASVDASFFYGVQAGVGGINLSNNATIIGNVYTSGSVTGGNGSSITGDAILALGTPTMDAVSDPSVSPLVTKNIGNASSATYLAQSFVSGFDDRVYSIDLKIAKYNTPTTTVTLYIYSDNAGNPGTNLSGSGQVLASAPNDTPAGWENGWTSQVFTPATQLVSGASYWLVARVSSSSATRYWKVVTSPVGNDAVYTNGTAKLDGDLTAMPAACVGGCDIAFRVNVGGVAPTLSLPTVGANAYARTISNTTVGQKAYYQNLSGTVRAAGGSDTCTEGENGPNCFDNSPDEPPQNFPLTTAEIAQMEAQGQAGGTVTCTTPCQIGDGSIIGPKKYVGDVQIINGSTVTLNGTVWVKGNILIENNSVLQLSAGYGTGSGIIIADNPDDPAASGRITLSNNGDLRGNGTAGTYIMALAMNADPTLTLNAVAVTNNLTAAIVYAAYGTVDISNNAGLKEVTGQKIRLQNNATITYESGLASVIFSGGPGGSWQIVQQTWREL